jgi:hypothetical protein
MTKSAAAASFLMFVSSMATAGTPLWGKMAQDDLAAAKKLIEDNHPAAAPELADSEFQSRLGDYGKLSTLAGKVTTFGGYRAVIDRFAASLGDRHIARYPIIEPVAWWPGFLVSQKGAQWIVSGGSKAVPAGSVLLGCDGKAPDDLATTNLRPYTPDWTLRAQRHRASASLFVNQEDPTIRRPETCSFRLADGRETNITLDWSKIGRETLKAEIDNALKEGKRENGVEPFEGGWWLKLASFQDDVHPTVTAFEAMRPRLDGAPFVIVDVRGNVGGSSSYGDTVAKVLFGSKAVTRAQRAIALGKSGPPVWRASPGNLELIDEMVGRFSKELGPSHSTTRYFVASAKAMRDALAAGKGFSQAAETGDEEASSDRPLGPLRKTPKVYLLTDFACFSACLEAAQLFRQLGAVQIGEDTDGGLNYFEVRAVPLPSGLAYFSTLQAYSKSRPRRLGPFEPSVRYQGDPSDEAAVRSWLKSTVNRG